ncbi:hypothetical protein PEBR_42612 [Penicillium brasilianum]|uniref:Uncharacterized protein n=1 Tax=Penicillium brasilianum TaxID=104259 RepID=A0A1S9R7P8_PENBI|nr:hypothetical protein PEBR_42612 [Penicillium brasilianum]
MQSVSVQFSPVKDGRRILGEKDSNACLSPARHGKQSLSVTSTPVKRTLFTTVSPKKLLPSPIFAGQKRTIDQVDEVDVNDASLQAPRELRVESPPCTVEHESQQLSPESAAMKISIPAPSSQPTRDQPQEMDTTRSRSASRASDSDTASIPDDPDARKAFIQEKAALLRNRLQTAMRNVPNHQIDRRVSELEAHSRKAPRLSFSALSSSSPVTSFRHTFTPSQLKTPRTGSAENMSSTPSQQTPDLPRQPSSIIQSTNYAKRCQRTPPRALGSPMQLSSPPATVVRYSRSRDITDGVDIEDAHASHDALSPSQRGDAVDGLLKLMSTSDRNDNPEAWSG